MDNNIKNFLIKTSVIVGLLVIFYFFASPYQNCLREIKKNNLDNPFYRAACLEETNW